MAELTKYFVSYAFKIPFEYKEQLKIIGKQRRIRHRPFGYGNTWYLRNRNRNNNAKNNSSINSRDEDSISVSSFNNNDIDNYDTELICHTNQNDNVKSMK